MRVPQAMACLFTGALILSLSVKAGAEEQLYYAAPSQMQDVRREMKTAGFWIGRQAHPDNLVMDQHAILEFNRHVREDLKLTRDLSKVPAWYNGAEFKQQLETRLADLKTQGYFADDGQKSSEDFFTGTRTEMALEAIGPEIPLEYGLITRFADQRFLPGKRGLYAKAQDIDFDELQNSGLDLGTAVVILHQSADKKWFYVMSDLSEGWVEAENVALCSRRAIEKYLAAKRWVVVTENKADLYLDQHRTQAYDHVRMGVKFPSGKKRGKAFYSVMIPTRDVQGRMELRPAFINRAQVSVGFLPYTMRTVLEQAFKLLNEPYGWGDRLGEQDCSRFVQEIFATVGIVLPRDSRNQALVGVTRAAFESSTSGEEKLVELTQAAEIPVLLYMKGHILLYLGMEENRPYAIHAVWAYRQPNGEEDRVRVINRVAVSDLFLGEGSKKGSLLNRMSAIIELSHGHFHKPPQGDK
ncbi:MAG: hypothetical protein A2Z81_01815 [Omnitrophica WOR_2 bacterium GWA2_45_18]|nr:MAG: hypothetical protein A2Z81_01815 [Omnitrophica WOR_2 bacterium GWA2_45_18]